MSDFAGLWRLDGQAADQADLRRLAQGLEGRHIGPARIWRSGPMGLVHRQHVFTAEDEAERMPLAGASGQVLVADAFLTGRGDLLGALGLESDSGRIWTDGGLILAGVERWGVDGLLARLNGPFAFALWDPRERRLVLARDPVGQRTLYFHRGPDIVAFATRVRPLLALAEIPRDLDDLAVGHTVIYSPSRPNRTVYKAVDRVPAGQMAVVDTVHTRVGPWWRLPSAGSLRHRDDAEVEEAAREILDRAVRDFLRAKRPVTAWLTGGLDTGMVTSTAARLLAPDRLTALTRIPDGPIPAETRANYYDESSRARALAARYPNVDWHAVGDDGGDWGEHQSRRWHLESGLPLLSPLLNIAWFFPLFRFMAKSGSHVSLGGDRGNSFFSFNGRTLLPALFLRLRWGELTGHLRAMARKGNSNIARMFLCQVLGPMEPLSVRLLRKGWQVRRPWARFAPLNHDFASEIRLGETLDRKQYRLMCGAGTTSEHDVRKFMLSFEWGQDALGPLRAMSGVDCRGPLGDRRVVEFFGSLPLEQFLRDGEHRSLARRLLANAAPPQTAAAHASGVQNSDWFTRLGRLRPAMQEELSRLRASPLACRVVNLDRIQAALDRWPDDVEAAQRRKAECYTLVDNGLEMARFLAWHEGGNR